MKPVRAADERYFDSLPDTDQPRLPDPYEVERNAKGTFGFIDEGELPDTDQPGGADG